MPLSSGSRTSGSVAAPSPVPGAPSPGSPTSTTSPSSPSTRMPCASLSIACTLHGLTPQRKSPATSLTHTRSTVAVTARSASPDTDAARSSRMAPRFANRSGRSSSALGARLQPPRRRSPGSHLHRCRARRRWRSPRARLRRHTRGRRRRRPIHSSAGGPGTCASISLGSASVGSDCHVPSPNRGTSGRHVDDQWSVAGERQQGIAVDAQTVDLRRRRGGSHEVTVDQRPDRTVGRHPRDGAGLDGERDRFTLGRHDVGLAVVGVHHDQTGLADPGQRSAGAERRQPERRPEAEFDRIDRPRLRGGVVQQERARAPLRPPRAARPASPHRGWRALDRRSRRRARRVRLAGARTRRSPATTLRRPRGARRSGRPRSLRTASAASLRWQQRLDARSRSTVSRVPQRRASGGNSLLVIGTSATEL